MTSCVEGWENVCKIQPYLGWMDRPQSLFDSYFEAKSETPLVCHTVLQEISEGRELEVCLK